MLFIYPCGRTQKLYLPFLRDAVYFKVVKAQRAWLEVILVASSSTGGCCRPLCAVERLVEAKRTARAVYLAYELGLGLGLGLGL